MGKAKTAHSERTKLVDVTKRVDGLIKQFEQAIEAILDALTAEAPYIGALFDCSDREGMEIYRELGLEPGGEPGRYLVLDVLQQAVDEALRKRRYVPIDELPGYEPGTVLLYVFTKGVVVARRFESFAGVRRGLREVRRTRDVEFEPTGLRLEGQAALELIVQRCGSVLRDLWDGGTARVALIESVSHGAKAGYITREAAVRGLRERAATAPPSERDAYLGMADSLASGPHKDGTLQCVVQGWGTVQTLTLAVASFEVPAKAKPFGKPDEEQLAEYIVACRDQKRALGVFEKWLDKVGSAPGSGELADLLALLRHSWNDYDAILAKIATVADASVLAGTMRPGAIRLRLALSALWQATTERQRGAAINASGGSS